MVSLLETGQGPSPGHRLAIAEPSIVMPRPFELNLTWKPQRASFSSSCDLQEQRNETAHAICVTQP